MYVLIILLAAAVAHLSRRVRVLERRATPPAVLQPAEMDKFSVADLTKDAIDRHVSKYHRSQP